MSQEHQVRNLDQIQEEEPGRGMKLGTLVLASLGGAFLVFAAIALVRKPSNAATAPPDPLGELVLQANAKGPALSKTKNDLPRDITFPGILSDAERTTTALVAMRKDKDLAEATEQAKVPGLPPGAPTAPPPATDKLPVVPLPAQHVAAASPIVTRPRDALTLMATEASATALEGPAAEEGQPGGYQLQASSFRSEAEAKAFAEALRKRGHKAHVQRAEIEGRGTWYRVRIGPFRSRAEARSYRFQFEQKEHVVPYLVEPGK